MSSAILKALCFFLFSSITFGKTQTSLQYHQENTYRNTVGPLIFLDAPLSEHLTGSLGAALAFSSQDFEAMAYSSRFNFNPLPWTSLSLRLSHRMNLPETFSRTSLLFTTRMEGNLTSYLKFFGLIGWYKRFTQLRQAQAIPTFTQVSFSEHDFATEVGFNAAFSPRFEWTAKIATFDEVDTFNLNNPFVESTFVFSPEEGNSRWLASLRYQILLGFGRLDRLTFILGYQWGV